VGSPCANVTCRIASPNKNNMARPASADDTDSGDCDGDAAAPTSLIGRLQERFLDAVVRPVSEVMKSGGNEPKSCR
jgi:hypothetical protein